MNLELPWLLLSLVLLWFPRRWLPRYPGLFRRRRRHSTVVEPWRAREPGDPRIGFVEEFTKGRNYVDLLRSAAGGVLLFGGLGLTASLAPAADAPRNVVSQVQVLQAVVVVIGVLLQTVRYQKGHLSFYPPVFYLGGISIALCGPGAAAFAFVLIWAFNAGLPHAQAFLSIYALLLIVFGHLLARGISRESIIAGVVSFLPVLLSLLLKRPLTVLARRAKQ